MIISRSRNFIFVRTKKVAGTSIEFSLSRHCGDDDVITPIRNDIERAALGVWPRNFMRLPRLEDEYRAVIAGGDAARLLQTQKEMRHDMVFWDHISAGQIRDRVGEEFWNKSYKFSVTRHPYEFVLSLMYFQMAECGVTPMRDGQLAVDKVLRYEALTDELRNLGAVIGVDISGDLPRFKAGIRPPTAVLAPWARRLVHWRWKREFKTFGYSP